MVVVEPSVNPGVYVRNVLRWFLNSKGASMDAQHQKDDEDIMTDENKIIDFKQAQIKAAGTGGGKDWLSQLPVGTTFLYRTIFRQPNSADVGVQLATVAFKYDDVCTQLHSQVGENSPEVVYIVENIPFSNVMRKVKVLYVPEPDPE